MRPRRPKEEQIVVWIGVIAQLVRTRNNQTLRHTSLPHPQFVLLLHFCHDPDREWTVSSLADAFQSNQPGITKTVKKLLERRYLSSRRDAEDARVRKLRVTKRGIRARNNAIAMLGPDLAEAFRGWKSSEVSEFHRLLELLKNHLDAHRNDPIPSVPSSPLRGSSR